MGSILAVWKYLSRFFHSGGVVREEMTLAHVQRIVSSCGAVLEQSAGPTRDIDLLPFKKEQIKTALLTALSVTTDATMREHLKAGYVSLADFQTLSEAERASARTWESVGQSDPQSMTHNDVLHMAKEISGGGGAGIEAHKRGTDEAAVLIQELKAAGF
jgi:hypothetical protein